MTGENIKANQKRYRQSEKGRAKALERQRRYRSTPEFKAKAAAKRATPEHKEYMRKIAQTEKHKETQRQYRSRPDVKARVYGRRAVKKYGLSVSEIEDKLAEQNYWCAICNDSIEIGKRCHVDHDHATGKVRGMLCNHCNLMLGHARDSTTILVNAIDYLRTHGGKK